MIKLTLVSIFTQNTRFDTNSFLSHGLETMKNTFYIIETQFAMIESNSYHPFHRFELGTYYYNIQYGYMSYPLRHISQSASVFMTIAITFERYCAVHHPINYNQVGLKITFQN